MRVSALSDIGLVRTRNEDSFWCDEQRGIFIIADGLGGSQAGDVAATMAVERVSERLVLAVDRALPESDLADEMHEAFQLASEEVFSRGHESEETHGMACALLAAVVRDDYCLIAHAGDSRAYLYYDGSLHQVTVDDTPVAAMIKRGFLLPEKARSHVMKNMLLKSVGNKPTVEANLTRFTIKAGEKLVFCSDGLWSMTDDGRMRQILQEQTDPEAVCREMIRSARESGGQDNITVIVVEVSGPDSAYGDETEEMPDRKLE